MPTAAGKEMQNATRVRGNSSTLGQPTVQPLEQHSMHALGFRLGHYRRAVQQLPVVA